MYKKEFMKKYTMFFVLLAFFVSCTEEKEPCTETVTFPGTTSTIEKPCD